MSNEMWFLVVAIVAALAAGVWYTRRRLKSEKPDHQYHAETATAERAGRSQAELTARIEESGANRNHLVVENVGAADAFEVSISGELETNPAATLSKLMGQPMDPIERLTPRSPRPTPIMLAAQDHPPLNIRLEWKDPDGTLRSDSMPLWW